MVGAGMAAAAMQTSLKNNSRRKKREPFKRMKDYLGPRIEKTNPIYKKATEKQLNTIRKRMQLERKALFIKRTIIMTVLLSALVTITVTLLSN